MSIIDIEFDLKIPTGWLVDPTASVDNSTETLTVNYRGDDKCFVAVDENGAAPYGFGAVSEKEMLDGTPEQGEDYSWVEIDCTENPIFCSLHSDLDPELALEDGAEPNPIFADVPGTTGFEGYPSVQYNTLFEATDFYRTSQINMVDSEPFLIPYTSMTYLYGSEAMDLTWDMVRTERDSILTKSDGWIAEDMPQTLKDQVLAYRTLLRDMTSTLAGVPVHLVMRMWPEQPAFMQTATPEGE